MKTIKALYAQAVQFHKDEEGDLIQTLMIGAVFAIAVIGMWMMIGPKLKDNATTIGDQLDDSADASF